MTLKVHIEYCGSWGYEGRAYALRDAIRAESPDDVDVTASVGRSQSFEVTIDDELIYSKFETMGFPIEGDIVAQVKKATAGETTVKVTTSAPPVELKGMLWIVALSIIIFNYRSILAAIKSYLF